MIKFGTIGTSTICDQFISSVKTNKDIELVVCYSRDINKAQTFINKNEINATPVASFDELANMIDAVYIATPNGLHYEQAKFFLKQKIHVFLEKPLTMIAKQVIELKELAQEHNVVLMEAFKVIHLPQYKFLKEFVEIEKPSLASFSMNQYSSRMEDVKKGIFNSVFDAKLGKGSTYDILVYPLELAISLFGIIQEVKSMRKLLSNGVAITDVIILQHLNGTITSIVNSKAHHSVSPSEIFGDKRTLTFKTCTQLNEINVVDTNNVTTNLLALQKQDAFAGEIATFVSLVKENNRHTINTLLDLNYETIRVLNLIENN